MPQEQAKIDVILSADSALFAADASRQHYWEVAASCAIFVLLLAAWQAVIVFGNVSPLLLPPPLAVGSQVLEDLADARYLGDLVSTATAMFSGFAIGSLVGIAFGAVLAIRPALERIFHPYFVAFQTFPKVALAPLLSVWLGYEQTPKVVLAGILAFFPVMVNALVGFRATRDDQLELLRAMEASIWQTFWKVRFPNALGYLFAGIEMALIFALLGTITAEVLGSKAGLGHLLIIRMSMLDVVGVFALLVVFAVLGTVCYLIGTLIHKRVVFWT